MASMGAQVAVLVTTKMPTDNDKAHLRDGIWVCGFHEYTCRRSGKMSSTFRVIAAEGARDAKADVMYDFLTSVDFARNIEQMVSPIFRMKEQLEKEKSAFGKIWKERQSLIEGSIGGATSLYMKIQGIAQIDLPVVKGLESVEQLVDQTDDFENTEKGVEDVLKLILSS